MTINVNKIEVLLLGKQACYFRAKTDESRQIALNEVVSQLEDIHESELSPLDAENVKSYLEDERERRHEKYQRAARRAFEKAEAQANLPTAGGYIERAIGNSIKAPCIITCVQNNTHLHDTALACLRNIASEYNAPIYAGRTFYNKNAFAQPTAESSDESILFDVPGDITLLKDITRIDGTNVIIIGNANVIPTAKNPCAGFENIVSAGETAIIPATKVSLLCSAALKGAQGKRFYSTGALSMRNYIQRKAGQVAESEHNIAGLFVEADGSIHILELMPSSNYINIFNRAFHANGTAEAAKVAALQFGDIHAEKCESDMINRIARPLIEFYEPANIVLHDLMDFASRNHHNRKDCTFIFRNDLAGNSVVQDCNSVIGVINEIGDIVKRIDYPDDCVIHVIESNHDLALDRWLKETDFKLDSINALFYLEAMRAQYRAIQTGGEFNALEWACSIAHENTPAIWDAFGNALCYTDYLLSTVFHRTDDSVMIAGVECGLHGHNGINGAKGTPQSFRKLGIPLNTGHTHTPSICGPVYTAGVAGSLDMGYNTGPSSWAQAHIVTYANGQRNIVFSDRGEK